MSGRASLHAGFSSQGQEAVTYRLCITTDMFDINTTLFELLGYRMSLLEALAVITGLLTTWFAARANMYHLDLRYYQCRSLFRLYYQVNLYSAMSLQALLLRECHLWLVQLEATGSDTDEPVTLLSHRERISWAAVLIISAMALGTIMGRIHIWLPGLFPERATFIYIDAMIAVVSIGASLLCARLKARTGFSLDTAQR